MSHIFDALRKSEAASSGIDLSALPGATALLQQAERRAVSQWETAALSEHARPSNRATPDTPLSLVEPRIPREIHDATAQPSQSEEPPLALDECKVLPVALDPQSRLLCVTDAASPTAEAFRLLAVRLRHIRRQRPLKTVLITSTIPEEGKSLVAANLACALAVGSHEKTLLLEGDLRRPSLSAKFGLGRNPGLCECLKGERTLATSVYRLEGLNLWILPAGSTPSNAQELLQSGRLASLMEELTASFDCIVIDSPPVLPLADTSIWMRLANGILLVTRQGITQKRSLLRGIEALEQKKLIGALVNSSTASSAEDYYYYRGAPPTMIATSEPAA